MCKFFHTLFYNNELSHRFISKDFNSFIFRARVLPGCELGKEMEKEGRAPARMKIFGKRGSPTS